MGRPGPGLGDTGQDCLICDAEGMPVGIGGVMGGASSEIDDTTARVLLEAAYFVPMAVARTSKRLGIRTEASARFERGCDPAGIDRASERFCDLLSLTAGEAMTVADGAIDVRGDVPTPVELTIRPERINTLLGTAFTAGGIAELLGPLGIESDRPEPSDPQSPLRLTVPTYRPDIRSDPMGEADIAEEVARTYGYRGSSATTPSWPQPGRLTTYQRDRRRLKDVLRGLGCSEAWTATFVSESDQISTGFDPPYVEVTNPLVESERFLRSSMAAGLIRAILYNVERRQGGVRLFEVGSVFHRRKPAAEPDAGPPVDAPERLSAVFALEEDDAWTAVAAWRTVAEAMGIAEWVMGDHPEHSPVGRALHTHRSASVSSIAAGQPDRPGGIEQATELGVVGELHPALVAQFGLVNPDGRPRRVGWLDLDIGVLLDRQAVPRRPEHARPVSRFPSSDFDLAFVVEDTVPAGSVERTLRRAGGDLLESVELFDVYRGPSVAEGSRSLAFHLRFCALDRTLTDEEIGSRRAACIDAVAAAHGARLR